VQAVVAKPSAWKWLDFITLPRWNTSHTFAQRSEKTVPIGMLSSKTSVIFAVKIIQT
jgi:hypothetical protein